MQVLVLHISCPQYVPAVTENSVYRKFTGSCAAFKFFFINWVTVVSINPK